MKTLALEFSSEQRSVAVCNGAIVKSAVSEMGGRSTRAIAMIESALAQAGWSREEIECIAVGLGPGSYTGIRAAIAIAQGWQLAHDIKLIGVSSMECLAWVCKARGLTGTVHPVVDAQKNEFCLATYEINAEGFRETGVLKLAARDAVLSAAASGGIIIGPGAAGEFPGAVDIFPDATALAGIGATRREYVPGEKLDPVYLREISFVKAPPVRMLPE